MSTYYVRESGNDSSGNGSDPSPWRTLSKAHSTISWTGDHLVLIGPGTYNENFSGMEYLLLQRTQSGGYLTFQAENGNPDSVIIKGNNNVLYQLRIDNASGIKLKDLSFSSNVNLTDLYSVIRLTGNVHHIELNNCKILVPSVSGRTLFGFFGEATGSNNFNTITIDGCQFNQSGIENAGLLRIGRQVGSSIVDNIIIKNNKLNALLYSMYLYGITNLLLDNNIAVNTSQSYPNVTLGANADAGLGCSGLIKNSSFSSSAGHALLVGAICSNIELNNLIINGGDQGLVIKHSNLISIYNCLVNKGSINAFYCKGATNVVAKYNRIINNSGVCVRVGPSGDGTKSGNINFQHNQVFATDSAKLLGWADLNGDNGGGICNYNGYRPGPSSSPFGTVRSNLSIDTLLELRSSWNGYGDGLNDDHSYIISNTSKRIRRYFFIRKF